MLFGHIKVNSSKMKEFQIEAAHLLCHLFPKKYFHFEEKEQPDLQFEESNIGVEITSVNDQNFMEATSLLKQNTELNTKRKIISKKGVQVGKGFVISKVFCAEDTELLITKAIRKKQTNSCNYKKFKYNELFIKSDFNIDFRLCQNLQKCFFEKSGREFFFDLIYILNNLYLYMISKDDIEIITIDEKTMKEILSFEA